MHTRFFLTKTAVCLTGKIVKEILVSMIFISLGVRKIKLLQKFEPGSSAIDSDVLGDVYAF
jgi:hypothetical protein